MKIELNLDMDKIDIDIINREVEKQLSQRNLKEDYDIEHKIEAKVDQFIDSAINDELYDYKDQYGNPKTKTKNIISIAVNEEVSSLIQQYIIIEIKRVLDKYKSNNNRRNKKCRKFNE